METKKTTPKSEYPLPDNLRNTKKFTSIIRFLNAEVEPVKKNLRLTFKWDDPSGWLFIIMGAFFWAFLAIYLPEEISMLINNPALDVLLSFFIRIGVVTTINSLIFYSGLCYIINKTTILVTPQTITIKCVPLPWSRSKEINVNDLKNIYTTTSTFKGKHREFYDLRAALKNGEEIKLITSVLSLETLEFSEKQIKQYLSNNQTPTLTIT